MKKAKITLTAVAVLAVVGGALAFKASRNEVSFYSLGTTKVGAQTLTGCVVEQKLQLLTVAPSNPNGFVTPYSIATNYPTTTCTARVIIGE